ncbi:LacI family DNA-binding transcriptional regulator [Paenibacillus wynnii]|uniref:LacI family DNA-binding transcriptional regulator n=1 Tax=Paenibacillus wynnii TaxID=268407 RepID=UPI002792C7C0|nr:LacI family DNA-binding transcriptional regulator [Paenibacillus wynnii]MDQ0195082.1 LacI family transcriptional regulator [Paenibacillus wynnii]
MAARIKDVAQHAGVSTATVSHVINQTRYVSQEVVLKVKQAMDELNYTPNPVARSLRNKKSGIIGLIVPIRNNDNSNHFFMSIANGIESILKSAGYHLLLSNSQENHEEEMRCIKMFNTQNIDGLIIAPTEGTPLYKKEGVSADYPIVFVDRKPKSEIRFGDCIVSDSSEGTYQGIKALVDKGYKKIGYITSELGLTSVDERMEGYKTALMDSGIKFDESLVWIGEGTQENGYEYTRKLTTEQAVDALFVANNIMGKGVITYIRDAGLRVPDQLGVIVYDDYEWTEVMDPPISVIQQQSFELGRKSAEVMISRIQHPDKPFEDYRLPAELIVRGSF